MTYFCIDYGYAQNKIATISTENMVVGIIAIIKLFGCKGNWHKHLAFIYECKLIKVTYCKYKHNNIVVSFGKTLTFSHKMFFLLSVGNPMMPPLNKHSIYIRKKSLKENQLLII